MARKVANFKFEKKSGGVDYESQYLSGTELKEKLRTGEVVCLSNPEDKQIYIYISNNDAENVAIQVYSSEGPMYECRPNGDYSIQEFLEIDSISMASTESGRVVIETTGKYQGGDMIIPNYTKVDMYSTSGRHEPISRGVVNIEKFDSECSYENFRNPKVKFNMIVKHGDKLVNFCQNNLYVI